ncbi:MAG: GGDEF domain-containing protein [Chloroflexi bacterium]|nr:GGDEF domain-containing protein [Chloroflexota bacterium]
MKKDKVVGFKTDFAPARRLSLGDLKRQHEMWAKQEQATLIGRATPSLILVLNECRQIVYSNDHFQKLGSVSTFEEYLGQRPGELLGCLHAFETEGGCGTTIFCRTCGAVKAMLLGLNGMNDVEECNIIRSHDLSELKLRVWTTPVELSGENFTIFSVEDISVEQENQRLLEEVQKLAVLDPLTGIYNRRAFFEIAKREIIRCMRNHNSFTLVMIDLDNFKQINDQYGHPTGDEVLIGFVQRMNLQLRDSDIFARYGGDEFVLLLPETDLAQGKVFFERIVKSVDSSALEIGSQLIPLKFSAGAADYQFERDRNIEEVLNRADQVLYEEKKKRHRTPS